MAGLIIEATREGYGLDQVRRTMTVRDLVEWLSEYPGDTPVYIGNDRKDYGFYTYGGIHCIEEVEPEDDEAEDDSDPYFLEMELDEGDC